MSETPQDELNLFSSAQGKDGYQGWRQQRAQAQAELSTKVGLPLGRQVEVRLYDGVVLRGILKLKEELLFLETLGPGELELMISRATFRQSEIEACVVLD